ncbi:MAG: hypothetical protein AAF708_07490 [Deinococcota bacterium]
MPDAQKPFFLEQDKYVEHFKPIYEKIIDPKQLIQFAISLPFLLRLDDGAIISFEGEGSIATLIFHTFNINEGIADEINGESITTLPSSKTRVEMVAARERELSSDTESELSDIFNWLLTKLNLVIRSYIIVKKDINAYPVSREKLFPTTIYRIIQLPEFSCPTGLLILNMHFPYESKPIPIEQQEKVMWFANVLDQGWNPFLNSEEFALDAKREFSIGNYGNTIIHMQTSIETFLSTLYVQCRVLENISIEDAILERENISFIGMVKREFATRIGGSWNINDNTSTLGAWYNTTYSLRNRVAHGGYRPSYHEALNALTAAINLKKDIIDRIQKLQKQYTDIKKFFVFGNESI